MKFRPALLCLLFLAGAAAGRAQDVSVDFDRGSDFSKFKTYSWAEGVPAKNPLIDQQIRSNIEGQLAARGLRRVEEGSDIRVLYMAAKDRDIEFAKSNCSGAGRPAPCSTTRAAGTGPPWRRCRRRPGKPRRRSVSLWRRCSSNTPPRRPNREGASDGWGARPVRAPPSRGLTAAC